MELWYTERQTDNVGITCRVKGTLHSETTDFQDMAVIDTVQFGRMLVLDGMVQTTVEDEFVYHEMITHVALATHPNPKRVAVIGGGDGGAIREILKHPEVEKATLVEIDGRVIEVSKAYLPEISGALSDPRAEISVEDGLKHVREKRSYYDVILVDSTEPVGVAVGLFSAEFYADIYGALKDDGIMVAQTESPFYNKELIANSFSGIKASFPICRLYLASIPTYPSGLWSFTLGSKKYDPLTVSEEELARRFVYETKYYNPGIHKAAFALPSFVAKLTGAHNV